MRRLGKQDSPEGAVDRSCGNELLAYKMDPLSKSFRKKYQMPEHSAANSSSNLIKTFSKNRLRQPYPPRESPPKALDRRSNSKTHHSRQVEKISLTSHAYLQANALATTSKLLKINSIFSRKL
jgi:hypothetical protein